MLDGLLCALKKLHKLIPENSENKVNANIKAKQKTNKQNHSSSPSVERTHQDGLWLQSSSAQVRGLNSLGLL